MEASDITDHISKRFNRDLEHLRSLVLTMGGKAKEKAETACDRARQSPEATETEAPPAAETGTGG